MQQRGTSISKYFLGKRFKKGDPVEASRFEEMRKAIRAIGNLSHQNYGVERTRQYIPPFKVLQTGTSSVTVRQGSILWIDPKGNEMPSNHSIFYNKKTIAEKNVSCSEDGWIYVTYTPKNTRSDYKYAQEGPVSSLSFYVFQYDLTVDDGDFIFSPDSPDTISTDGKVYIPLAEVKVVEEVTYVERQIIENDLIVDVISNSDAHPFRVIPNGDATVSILPGFISHWNAIEDGNEAILIASEEYAGTSNLGVSGNGYVYAIISTTSKQKIASSNGAETLNIQVAGSITVSFDTVAPAAKTATNEIVIALAKVSLTNGKAQVDEQYITHNPIVSLQSVQLDIDELEPAIIPILPKHPWQISDAGNGNVNIEAGYILGYYLDPLSSFGSGGDSSGLYPFLKSPTNIIHGPGASYAGGVEAINGTKYIYAEYPRNAEDPGTGQNAYSQAKDTEVLSSPASGDSSLTSYIGIGDDISPKLTDTATITVSNDDPETFTPATGNAASCIGKVVNNAGNLTITQYVYGNPTVFIPILDHEIDLDTKITGVPSGTNNGDLLYWNSATSKWVVLSAPSVPLSGDRLFLEFNHTTDVPQWTTLTEQELDICDSGTPSTIEVLKL